MEIEDPFDLTGIYEGIPLTEKSVEHSGTLPDRIRLFRRPILDEWADGEDSLEHLVAHILIHEVGHHFGFSDERHARARGSRGMTPLLRFEGVTLRRGGRLLFEGLDLKLGPGEALHLSGPNGSGKSSLIRLAAGLLRADARAGRSGARWRLPTTHLALDRELPLKRALDVLVAASGPPIVDEALDALGLAALADVPVRLLSTGQAKRAALARVAASGAASVAARRAVQRPRQRRRRAARSD